MSTKLTAQIILCTFAALGFLVNLYRDVNGRPALEPRGFGGIVGSLIAVIISVTLYYFSGALSEILH